MVTRGAGLDRRGFLQLSMAATLGLLSGMGESHATLPGSQPKGSSEAQRAGSRAVKLFLCGDVMTGRGIDQVLPHPGDPTLYEPYMTTALGYVQLAERANGRIHRPVDFGYVWGDALQALASAAPDVRLINLETAVTRSNDYWPGKGINYRMHPDNLGCISAAAIDCCVLANNHVLDWGYTGLAETLASLHRAGLKTVGAGADRRQAQAPAVIELADGRRVIVVALGSTSSGIPHAWAASDRRAGVNLLPDFSPPTVRQIAAQVAALKRPRDIVVASIHWGGNWGYGILGRHADFAHRLIDTAGIDIIHGHSSHHPKGIEVYQGKLIIYGCGDFLNDYEGIHGHESYRGDLALLYLASVDPDQGALLQLEMVPMQIRRFRLNYASAGDARWLSETLDREGARLGTRVRLRDDGVLVLG